MVAFGSNSALTQSQSLAAVILGCPLQEELLRTHVAASCLKFSSSKRYGRACCPCLDFENVPTLVKKSLLQILTVLLFTPSNKADSLAATGFC